MQTTAEKTVLITGANAGIGKDVARQLALRHETARIYLACRNQGRAETAKAELETETGLRIFEIVVRDVANLDSVRAGLAGISGSVDALVMNAGVIGPQSMALTADRVTTVFATNVLGHVVLLEGLLAEVRLGEVAVLAGSEAARGLPKLGMKRPSFVSTSADELATVIDGSYFAVGKADFKAAIVRLNLRRRARHRHRRQLLERPLQPQLPKVRPHLMRPKGRRPAVPHKRSAVSPICLSPRA